MFENVEKDSMRFKHEGRYYDFDRYIIRGNKEYIITVDFLNKEIDGEVIKYGGWYDLELDECKEILKEIEEPIRDFSHLL